MRYERETLRSLFFGAALLIFAGAALWCPAASHEEGEEHAEETASCGGEEASSSGSPDIVLEELVVTGSRARPRSVIDSAVPIDVIGGESFIEQGGTDTMDLLRNVAPSFNVNSQPISDAATVVRPANLRGLPSDHTLVLVNHKRRHRASVIYWLGNGVSDGGQGADLSAIPAIAIQRIEILRDGASAQYGSDAIAGVLNFQLRDNMDGALIETRAGAYQEGDGTLYTIAGNYGFGQSSGWANLSAEYGRSGPTVRSVQRTDALNLLAAGNSNVRDPAQIWGNPDVRDDLKLFANYGAALSEDIQLFGHANYASKRVEGGFFFRNPNTRGGVFSGDGGQTLLIANLSGDGETPVVEVNGNVPDAAALQQVKEDDNLFSFQEMFPGGFTPRFGADTLDHSVLAGLRGALPQGLTWEVSGYQGRHESDFFIFNTVNASLGPETPTSFDPGAYIQTDMSVNLDMTYPVSEPLFLAAGLEYRVEEFEIVQGEEASYVVGPLAQQGFSSGSNGFPGFSDIAAGVWDRSNAAVYVEAEARPTPTLLIGAALRYEDFEDFGSTTNYKASANANVHENIRARASFSTGFRAPTPGQQNAFNVTTEFNPEKSDLVNRGTIPSTNPAAALFGGEPLKPEKSTNATAGIILTGGNATLTVDYFNIRVEDRLAVSQDFQLTPDQVDQLVNAGITSAANLQEFRFFTNDFETETQGVDVVLTRPVGNGGLSLAYNYTDNEVVDYDPKILDDLRIRLLEEGLPKMRWSATLRQSLTENLRAVGRASYYGSWFEGTITEHTFGDELVFDLEATYTLDGGATALTAGVQNLFNNYPDKNPTPGFVGSIYGEYSPFGFSGAFWYAKAAMNF